MAFPVLLVLALAAVGGGAVYVATKGGSSGGKSSPEHVLHGVKYGANCSSVTVIDPGAWQQQYMKPLMSAAKSLSPDEDAAEAVARLLRIGFPDCSWATDGSFDTLMQGPKGDIHWSKVLEVLHGKTLQQANDDDTLNSFTLGQQLASGSATVDMIRSLVGA
jgi:hypothetical protein